MALPANDDFAGTGALSASWSKVVGGLSRVSDECAPDVELVENIYFWNADAFSNNQYSEISLAGVLRGGFTWFGVVVRSSGISSATNNCYLALTDGDNDADSYYAKKVNDVETNLGNLGVAYVIGNTIKLEVEGTGATFHLHLYKNSSSVGTYDTSDSSHITGAAGLFSYKSAAVDDCNLDNFYGGNVGGGGAWVMISR